jgi:hypothetical protein
VRTELFQPGKPVQNGLGENFNTHRLFLFPIRMSWHTGRHLLACCFSALPGAIQNFLMRPELTGKTDYVDCPVDPPVVERINAKWEPMGDVELSR